MALTTYGELQTAVAAWATKSSLTAQVPEFIAWAHQEICRRLRAPVLYARAEATIDAETVEAPTDFLAAKRFYLDTSPRRVLTLTDSAHLIDLTGQYASQAYPEWFAVEGVNTLAFAPLFTGSATGKLLYYAAPETMSEDDDTNTVLAKYPFLYLYGSLEALFRYIEDDQNAQTYGAMFGGLIESINAEEAKDATRGPLTASASGMVV